MDQVVVVVVVVGAVSLLDRVTEEVLEAEAVLEGGVVLEVAEEEVRIFTDYMLKFDKHLLIVCKVKVNSYIHYFTFNLYDNWTVSTCSCQLLFQLSRPTMHLFTVESTE